MPEVPGGFATRSLSSAAGAPPSAAAAGDDAAERVANIALRRDLPGLHDKNRIDAGCRSAMAGGDVA